MPRSGLGAIYRRLAGDSYVRGLAGVRRRRIVKARSLLPLRLQRPVTVETSDGVRLRITRDPVDAEIADAVVNRNRAVYFPRLIPRPEYVRLVLEVGGHHGLYTAVAASEYPNARFLVLEPSLDAVEVLRSQIRLNGLEERVEVLAAAIGPSPGLATLTHDASGSWGATLQQPPGATKTERVISLPLSTVLAGGIPDVVKSNAEGAEFELVAQLDALDERPRVIVLAVHPEFGDVDALRERVLAAGYSVSEALGGHHPVWHCVLNEHQAGDGPAGRGPG